MTVTDPKNPRVASSSVEPMFVERWSSKAFADKALSDDQIASLFEAAHWAPSGSNRQPWLFVYATDGPDREKFNSLLNEGNARYAPNAAMLVLVFARIVDDEGKKIRTAHFDTGAAWMSLALQANRIGLNTRAMGGIDLDAAYDVAGVPRDKFETICAIAVGYRGADDDIHERMVKQNFANDRKDVSEIAFKGSYSG
ncbi:MAG: nitroreductase family protein [Chloroflexi bacterium]|jgi:nitroreductase|nr:nitroreductase family protein [Chloroflexota bacterium]MBT4142198.1 nitroreductase family protein [Chloroflexota bacterium]MBT7004490.1 nitroreductase family protein [Chloroflexota bacterium]MBT7078370.1 nitroreductase family protein [Chloroflexota bacterium]MBT7466694.1 nitroreductase family protein [Chloroflexota bacterium]